MARENRRLIDLIEDWSPRLRDAFLAAVAKIRDSAQIGVIVAMLERGDVNGAIDAVGLDPIAFRSVDSAIAQAFEDGGEFTMQRIPALRTSNARLNVLFDVRNPRAEDWLRERSSTLITEIVDDQRSMIRQHLTAAMEAGQNPRAVALDLVGRLDRASGKREGGVIGLTTGQDAWATRYARRVASSLPGDLQAALGMKLRDKRFDRAVEKAIREGRPVPAEMREKMVQAYRARALRYRGENIGRTEAMRSLHAAQTESYRQAIDAGQIVESTVFKFWRDARDVRVRETHRGLNGQRVAFRAEFVSPSGAHLRYPGDERAPVSETAQCRCWMEVKIDFLAALGPKPPAPPAAVPPLHEEPAPPAPAATPPLPRLPAPSAAFVPPTPPAPVGPARQPTFPWAPIRRGTDFQLVVSPKAYRFGLFRTQAEAKDLARTLFAGAPEGVDLAATWKRSGADLQLTGSGSDVHIVRTFKRDGGGLSVDHTYFAVAGVHQGGGHAKRMMRASLQAYDDYGVARVDLHANLEIGGYSWAKVGFAPVPNTARLIRTSLERAATYVTPSRAAAIRQRLANPDDRSLMYDVALMRDGDDQWGKGLLLGSNWYGFIDMIDPSHRAMLIEALR
jgi:hypothetical protein